MTPQELIDLIKLTNLKHFIVSMNHRGISGVFDYDNLSDISQYRESDMTYSISRLNRYNGYSKQNVSVGAHSLLVHNIARTLYKNPELWLEALVHDFCEAYCNDLVKPLKNLLPDYAEIEKTVVQPAIHASLGIKNVFEKEVKKCDTIALLVEGRFVFGVGLKDMTQIYSWTRDYVDLELLADYDFWTEQYGYLKTLLAMSPNTVDNDLKQHLMELSDVTGRGAGIKHLR